MSQRRPEFECSRVVVAVRGLERRRHLRGYIGGRLRRLAPRLREMAGPDTKKPIFVRADGKASYATVAQVMARLLVHDPDWKGREVEALGEIDVESVVARISSPTTS